MNYTALLAAVCGLGGAFGIPPLVAYGLLRLFF